MQWRGLVVMMMCSAAGCASRAASAPVTTAPTSDPPAEGGATVKASSEARAPFETGIASFYHPTLAGNETANGERYVPGERTCAHPSLAFGTKVEVKLVRTGASAVCRVNDRGPYAKNRVIDLSQGMADALGVAGDDIHKVELFLAE